MARFRISMFGLFGSVVIAALALGGVKSLLPNASAGAVAMGGLCLCTILFAALCGLFGNSASRVLVLSSALYLWGLACLVLTDAFDLNGVSRLLLAACGACYATWAWLVPARAAA